MRLAAYAPLLIVARIETDDMDNRFGQNVTVLHQRKRVPGELYVVPDRQKRCWPESWLVITEGDGTPERDTVEHGIFWRRENAELFKEALASQRKRQMSNTDWLTHLHSQMPGNSGPRLIGS
jgi:hypothetical protein